MHVVQALKSIQEGLDVMAKLRSQPDEAAVTLPGNQDCILDDAEKKLKRYKRVLNQVLPDDELWRFGVEVGNFKP